MRMPASVEPRALARPGLGRTAQLAAALLVIAFLVELDYLTGPYVAFSLLYLVPVAFIAWTSGAVAGVLAALFAVGCEAIVDWAWPQVTGLEVYVWNAFARAAVLALGAMAVARIRRTRDLLTDANARLDELLAAEARAHADTQHRLGLIADALSDYAIVLFDPADRARSWSAGTPGITGRDPATIAGQSLAELFPAAEPSEDDGARTSAGTSDRVEIERWTLREGRERYWANIIAYGLGAAPHRRLLAIVRDATARKRAEEEIRRARDEAVATMRELETFSYTVAHDLRAPLRAVDGFGGMLEEDAGEQLDPRGLAYVARMRQAARRMGRLIDDLLAMSRLGRAPVQRARVDLTAMARGIERDLRAADLSRDVDIVVSEGLSADADPRLVAVLLRALMENAWKFTSARERARIEVGAVAGPEPAFFVRDDGIGFDMAFAARLFHPFERLHTDDTFEGTGIGLAIARRVVERHGGRIWAESAVGSGATFYFTLPEPPPAPIV